VQDEESLVRRAKENDEAALTQLYEENFDKIYRYIVLKIGDRTEAEDMTQQVFLKAFKSISGYRSRGSQFSSWLFRIAHNQMVDYGLSLAEVAKTMGKSEGAIKALQHSAVVSLRRIMAAG
jgi:RNA polymerase sigma-70 factor (ECF subfamily)